MTHRQSLARPGEEDGVAPNDIARPDARDSNLALAPRALTGSPAQRVGIRIEAARSCGARRERKRRTGRRIELVLVMSLENFDVEVLRQHARCDPHELL